MLATTAPLTRISTHKTCRWGARHTALAVIWAAICLKSSRQTDLQRQMLSRRSHTREVCLKRTLATKAHSRTLTAAEVSTKIWLRVASSRTVSLLWTDSPEESRVWLNSCARSTTEWSGFTSTAHEMSRKSCSNSGATKSARRTRS